MILKRKTSSWKRLILWTFSIAISAGLITGWVFFGPSIGGSTSKKYFYIPTGATYDQVLQRLSDEGIITNKDAFDFLASKASYPHLVKAGKYRIKNGMSNYELVRMLRSGRQEPVRLVIAKLRTKEDFIKLIGKHLEADTGTLRALLDDQKYLREFGFDAPDALCAVIPDTYEFWWNTSADAVYRKLFRYHMKFWNAERLAKLETHDSITKAQAITIASIVEEETNNNPEKPQIASVYLNRVRKGMPLQADPTVKFALQDFTLRRITAEHTRFISAYNTYYATGLPPGPICTPSKASIEAVLNAPITTYLYFCAKEDFSGTHRFATTYDEHLANARKYQQALNKRGIR